MMGVIIDGQKRDFPDDSTIIRTLFEFNGIWSAQLLSTANLIANQNANANKIVSTSQGIQLIQAPKRGEAQGANNLAYALDLAPISGNSLFACIYVRQGGVQDTVTSIVQTGVVWSKQVNVYDTHNAETEIWRGIVGVGADVNITINVTNAANTIIANIAEFLCKGTLDKTATNFGDSVTPDSGTTAATTLATELWIGALSAQSQTQTTPTNNFTLVDGINVSGWGSQAFLYKIVNATGAANVSTTIPSQQWGGAIATFKSI